MELEVFNRPTYLKKLIEFKDTEFIKVLTGVRRSGKASILMMYQNYLRSHDVALEQIIYLSFEEFENIKLRSAEALYSYLKKRLITNKKMYILLDEIQLVDRWQEVINSLRLNPQTLLLLVAIPTF